MRYPMWRRNTDGTEFVVHDKAEAYAEPEKIAGFLPNKPIPEQAVLREPVTSDDNGTDALQVEAVAPVEPTTEPEAEDGLQDEEVDHQEEVTAAPAKRGPGRPKKVVA